MAGAPSLFEPLSIGGLTLVNRIAVSPMCQYSAENGAANDWHLQHLGSLSLSGAGLVIVEQTAVEPAGRITHGCLGLYSDASEAALARVVDFCRRAGSAALGIQLAHAGRKGSARLPTGERMLTAGASPTACAIRWKWPPRCARSGRAGRRSACALRALTGLTAASRLRRRAYLPASCAASASITSVSPPAASV